MKTRRHAKILEIINNTAVETQEDLQELLRQAGFAVTQATVSRDIKELRLIKSPVRGGGYRYTTAKGGHEPISAQFHSIFGGSVVRVQYAQNIVVVNCLPGMAQAACAAMDARGSLLTGRVGLSGGGRCWHYTAVMPQSGAH